jgi:Holliday junction resolvase
LNKSKRKGNLFEYEVVHLAQKYGISAIRCWGSDGRTMGLHPEVDVVIDGKGFQCKRRKTLPAYIKPSANVDGQIIRADREKALIVISLEDYLELLRSK